MSCVMRARLVALATVMVQLSHSQGFGELLRTQMMLDLAYAQVAIVVTVTVKQCKTVLAIGLVLFAVIASLNCKLFVLNLRCIP
jgi:hypothetical protein